MTERPLSYPACLPAGWMWCTCASRARRRRNVRGFSRPCRRTSVRGSWPMTISAWPRARRFPRAAQPFLPFPGGSAVLQAGMRLCVPQPRIRQHFQAGLLLGVQRRGAASRGRIGDNRFQGRRPRRRHPGEAAVSAEPRFRRGRDAGLRQFHCLPARRAPGGCDRGDTPCGQAGIVYYCPQSCPRICVLQSCVASEVYASGRHKPRRTVSRRHIPRTNRIAAVPMQAVQDCG